jgi:hypothetical protein
MAPRQQLQNLLEEIAGADNVHFQPPSNFEMSYPCIVYERDGSDTQHADNVKYVHAKRYQVTVIDRHPDSELPDQVEEQSFCEFERHFKADNLNHWVFTLFF